MRIVVIVAFAAVVAATASGAPSTEHRSPPVREYSVPAGTHPHDVAPARDGGVWYTAQGSGELGWLDPETGETRQIPLGAGSAPHGVIVGPDGAPWITDGGLNAIVRVDPRHERGAPLSAAGTPRLREPEHRHVRQPRRAVVHGAERHLWPPRPEGSARSASSARRVAQARTASRRRPSGNVYYASLAGSYLGRIDPGRARRRC